VNISADLNMVGDFILFVLIRPKMTQAMYPKIVEVRNSCGDAFPA